LRDIADNGQTVVVVTHDAALAARADRRIHIVDGKIHETTFGGHRKPEIVVATPAAECPS
jgi:lipoprotein-releasing system ATP-binding protein